MNASVTALVGFVVCMLNYVRVDLTLTGKRAPTISSSLLQQRISYDK